MELYRQTDGKLLRCGYTTGSCAAAAAKAASVMLLGQRIVEDVSIETPRGDKLDLSLLHQEIGSGFASCAVRKDSGDDPDATNGALVFARVEKTPEGISILGGQGIGLVTKPGLDQPVGAHAINSTPRRMTAHEVEEVCRSFGYHGGMSITISVPNGEELAKRTFNERLGIVGGLSILGTTGIVEPMSHAAVSASVKAQISVMSASGVKRLVFVLGNYGESFAVDELGINPERIAKISNCIGDSLDAAVEAKAESALVIGHIGKLVKLGIGIMNTHSQFGDGRMETLAACAIGAGAPMDALKAVMDSAAVDAALAALEASGSYGKAMDILKDKVEASLRRRAPSLKIGLVCFRSSDSGFRICIKSSNCAELLS
jgi:cobalt-precorrin-5B (C1)-methyltransferase